MNASFVVRSTKTHRVQRATGYIWMGAKPQPGDSVRLWSYDERNNRAGRFVRWNRYGQAIVQIAP